MKVRLEQLSSNHKRLRTSIIDGETPKIPVVGEPFFLSAQALDPQFAEGGRIFNSSVVEEVRRDGNEITFRTRNSTYKITIFEDDTL